MERLGLFTSEEGTLKSWEGGAPGDGADKGAKRGDKRDQKQGEQTGSSRKRERAAQKEIRRAYYRKSLQWHPDRWAGMGKYSLAVQGAFELINEAYTVLTGAAAEGSAGGGGGEGAGRGGAGGADEEGEVVTPEPVYD